MTKERGPVPIAGLSQECSKAFKDRNEANALSKGRACPMKKACPKKLQGHAWTETKPMPCPKGGPVPSSGPVPRSVKGMHKQLGPRGVHWKERGLCRSSYGPEGCSGCGRERCTGGRVCAKRVSVGAAAALRGALEGGVCAEIAAALMGALKGGSVQKQLRP